jgi:hypothetical protein
MKRWISLILLIAANGLFLALVLGPGGAAFEPLAARLALFAGVTVVTMLALKLSLPQQGWLGLFCAAGVLNATLYQLLGGDSSGLLRYVNDYPLSLGWSESSRYYYASLFFSKFIYGVAVPPPILHPSRYLMQAAAFIIPDAPLWFHRLWQVLLFDVTALATAWLLARRLKRLAGEMRPGWVFIGFAFLFLLQGPVYYHLLIMPMIILWAADSRRLGRTLLVVLLAAAWAGISRVNWLPVPGMLAATLYLLEMPLPWPDGAQRKVQAVVRYALPPLLWVLLGTLTGYLVQAGYKTWSGNPLEYFDSSFSSQLLWYRLWPNVTYPQGIVRTTLLASLPLLAVLFVRLLPRLRAINALRWLGLLAMLIVLLLGGTLVSLKIGGGSNLHNLDAYFVLSLVIGAYFFFQRCAWDWPPTRPLPGWWRFLDHLALLPLVFIPVGFVVALGGPLPNRDAASAWQTIAAIQQQVDSADGEILLMRERHLLFLGDLKNVPLVTEPEYEVVFAMEMAMADNQPYQQALRRDLTGHRFALIIGEPTPPQLLGPYHQFGEENDAWLINIAGWIDCTYEPLAEFPAEGLVVWTPRAKNLCSQ